MESARVGAPVTRESIVATVVARVSEMMIDWEREYSGELGADTYLVSELEFSSMDLVMLVVEIQQCYHRYDLPWEDLFAPDGRYVDDVQVAQIADFLNRHLVSREGVGEAEGG